MEFGESVDDGAYREGFREVGVPRESGVPREVGVPLDVGVPLVVGVALVEGVASDELSSSSSSKSRSNSRMRSTIASSSLAGMGKRRIARRFLFKRPRMRKNTPRSFQVKKENACLVCIPDHCALENINDFFCLPQ